MSPNEEKNTVDVTSVSGIECACEEVIAALKIQHPEWVQQDGDCPRCVSYQYEIAAEYDHVEIEWE